jgi:hypothetical protein
MSVNTIMPVSWRHQVPFAFVLSLMVSIGLSFFLAFFRWLFLYIIGLYFFSNVYSSVKIGKEKKDFTLLFIMPIIFSTLHMSYGLGSFFGVIRLLER